MFYFITSSTLRTVMVVITWQLGGLHITRCTWVMDSSLLSNEQSVSYIRMMKSSLYHTPSAKLNEQVCRKGSLDVVICISIQVHHRARFRSNKSTTLEKSTPTIMPPMRLGALRTTLIKFVSKSGFLRILPFPLPIKWPLRYSWNVYWSLNFNNFFYLYFSNLLNSPCCLDSTCPLQSFCQSNMCTWQVKRSWNILFTIPWQKWGQL